MTDTPTRPARSHVKPEANAMADKVCAHNKSAASKAIARVEDQRSSYTGLVGLDNGYFTFRAQSETQYKGNGYDTFESRVWRIELELRLDCYRSRRI
ncbi:hypothetical protein CNYM01_06913 [Colletotrichum nymphaeae SA-01]|uniref:Uncharacterized protein n=1 Tax=Colletotrichum nymphaeae SA-01 TaxID=1460502 RepID=A0A135RR16_9PEZI|nr:hypothetical protein CNYM01_06913 [Colletotrichum nymphaeae SA-01]